MNKIQTVTFLLLTRTILQSFVYPNGKPEYQKHTRTVAFELKRKVQLNKKWTTHIKSIFFYSLFLDTCQFISIFFSKDIFWPIFIIHIGKCKKNNLVAKNSILRNLNICPELCSREKFLKIHQKDTIRDGINKKQQKNY